LPVLRIFSVLARRKRKCPHLGARELHAPAVWPSHQSP
jgi:hypothetical protein